MTLRLVSLPLGRLEVSGAVLQSCRNFFNTVESACMAWLILGGEKVILVDSGPAGPDWSSQHHRPMCRKPDENILTGLQRHGLNPEDIDLIINTHLHWDHVYGALEIPHPPIWVQRAEMRYAAAPLARDARAYEADLGAPALKALWERLHPLDGDTTIMPGVRVISTPGHTPGSQAVLVTLATGVHALAGDTINLYSSLECDPPWPPGIFTNLEDVYASTARLRKEADTILPGHEPLLYGRQFPE